MTFNASASADPQLSFGIGQVQINSTTTSSPILSVADQGAFRLLEEAAGGTNYIEFLAPTTVGTKWTCTLQDTGAPIPDSCVGDGTDGGGTITEGTAIDVSGSTVSWDPTEVNSATWGAGAFTAFTFDPAGTANPVVTMGDGTVTWTGTTSFSLDNASALRLFEPDGDETQISLP